MKLPMKIVLPLLAAVVFIGAAAFFLYRETGSLLPVFLSQRHISAAIVTPPAPTFIQIVDSCGPHYDGTCVRARSGPGTSFPPVMKLRTGMVLKVATTTVADASGRMWYKIVFDEWLRYPERAKDMYVAADLVHVFTDPGAQSLPGPAPAEGAEAEALIKAASTTKRIVVDRTTQMLYAYDGDTLFLKTPVSTGLDLTPTPRGTFVVYAKSPTRYMQGPLPGVSDQYYDLPGVPWDLYFTAQGGALHGAYWHNEFGQQWSHGCVNLPLDVAKKLYDWTPLGTSVTVKD